MYTYRDNEMAERVSQHLAGDRSWPWFWFRDACLDGMRRGLVSVERPEDENPPFWWDLSRVALTERGRVLHEAVAGRQ